MNNNNKEKNPDLSTLVDINKPEKVFEEVVAIMRGLISSDDIKRLDDLFPDIVSLFGGNYPGFNACNTEYHDLKHTTDVFLCLARLVHGFSIEVSGLNGHTLFLCLAAAMMHDTGYIQAEGDNDGTGAKYTKEHVSRSIDFMRRYFEKKGYSIEDIEFTSRLIRATSIDLTLSDKIFIGKESSQMGGLLFAADMIGQMSDRVYLEKLLFLFREFNEAGVMGFDSEIELLNNTIGYYKNVRGRLDKEVANHDLFLKLHFRKRFNIDRNLYLDSIEKNISYLSLILEESRDGYRSRLNREGMIKRLEERENNN